MFNRRSLRHSLNRILLNYINKIPLSLNVKRAWIRSLHYSLPLLQLMLVTFGNKFQFYLGVMITISITIALVVLNGCILSSLENSLFNDNSNITDICLEFLKVKNTPRNQIIITQVSILLISIYMWFIYYFRFV